jgi:uncharacterized spore protein YtfJ
MTLDPIKLPSYDTTYEYNKQHEPFFWGGGGGGGGLIVTIGLYAFVINIIILVKHVKMIEVKSVELLSNQLNSVIYGKISINLI